MLDVEPGSCFTLDIPDDSLRSISGIGIVVLLESIAIDVHTDVEPFENGHFDMSMALRLELDLGFDEQASDLIS